jgi:hypothetical protein
MFLSGQKEESDHYDPTQQLVNRVVISQYGFTSDQNQPGYFFFSM